MNVLLVYPGGILSVGSWLDRALRREHCVMTLDALFLGVRELRDPLSLRKRLERILAERGTRVADFDAALFVLDHPKHHLPTEAFREAGVPTADWVVDTHLYAHRPAFHRALRSYDRVFSAQQGPAKHLADAGIAADWLPLAADPEVFRPEVGAHQDHDIGFLGTPRAERAALFTALADRYRVWYGVAPGERARRVYQRCLTGPNVTDHGEVGTRVFEVMASGCVLLTPPLNGLDELFDAGRHFLPCEATVRGIGAAVEELMREPDLAHGLRRAGLAEVRARHTYEHRARALLQGLGLRVQATGGERRVGAPMPWPVAAGAA